MVEFFYDIGSPYSYLAATRIEAIVADTGTRLAWRPFLLGGVYKATGNQMPAALPQRALYMVADLARWADFYGVTLNIPPSFPPMTLKVMRALTALQGEELVRATHAAFHAYWVHGEAIDDPAVIARVCGAEAASRIDDPAVKEALRNSTEEAVERGAFGAPTFFVGDEMFFGNDRLPFLEQRLRRRPA